MTKNQCKKYIKLWVSEHGFESKDSGTDMWHYFDGFSICLFICKHRFDKCYGIDIQMYIEALHSDEERATWHKWADASVLGTSVSGNSWFNYVNHTETDCNIFLNDIFHTYIKPFFDYGIIMVKKIVSEPKRYVNGKDSQWLVHPKAKEYVAKLETQS